MTLTALFPTLRESIPVPLCRDLWPAHTNAGVLDLTVDAVSVLRFVALCGTPAAMTAPAVVPLAGGIASRDSLASIVVASVASVIVEGRTGGLRRFVLDAVLTPAIRQREQPAEFGHCCPSTAAVHEDESPAWQPIPSELRLLGRVSHAHEEQWEAMDARGTRLTGVPPLPVDLVEGDLLALPCRGPVPVGELRRR